MLRKLKLKFIALSMSMVTAVVITGLIIIVVYNSTTEKHSAEIKLTNAIEQTSNYVNNQLGYYDSLYSLLYNFIPGLDKPSDKFKDKQKDNSADPSQNDSDNQDNNDGSNNNSSPPKIGREGEEDINSTPVATYVLTLDGDLVLPGGALSTAVMGSDILAQAKHSVIAAANGLHEIPNLNLVYEKQNISDITYVAFADISLVSSWKDLAASLLPIGVLLLALFFVVSVIAARYAIKPVAEAWESQQRFVADASHDLKTPLAVIMANNSILKSKPDAKFNDQVQWLDSTDEESNRMLDLINNMLTLAKIDDPKAARKEIKKTFTKFDLSEVVEGASLQFESVAFEKNSELVSNIEQEIYVFANADNIRKMVGTLLENSCKYAQDKDIITVELNKHAGSAILTINNSKSLISEEDLPHIFERFYRSDKSRTAATKDGEKQGHGLGLAIAKATVVECGGDLKASSNTERGTTFTASIPLAK